VLALFRNRLKFRDDLEIIRAAGRSFHFNETFQRQTAAIDPKRRHELGIGQ